MAKLAPLALAAILGSGASWAQLSSGRVVAIQDGDTLTVLIERQQVKVRLAEIDAPELGQAFGDRARQSLAALCFKKLATVEPGTKDRYGRTVAHVSCDGSDAATWQITNGMAWVYPKYAHPRSVLRRIEGDAKRGQRGLWTDPKPIPPWAWRPRKGQP